MDDAFVKLQLWRKTTGLILTGLLFVVIGIFLFAFVNGARTAIDSMAGSINNSLSVLTGVLGIFVVVFLLVVIVGFVLHIVGLSKFRKILDEEDGKAIGSVRNGLLLSLVVGFVVMLTAFLAGGFDLIPSAGKTLPAMLAGIGFVTVNITAYIMMLKGFNALRRSQTFPAKARRGASHLFVSMILNIIVVGLSFSANLIPDAEVVFGAIILIAGLFGLILMFMGWAKIKNADPNAIA